MAHGETSARTYVKAATLARDEKRRAVAQGFDGAEHPRAKEPQSLGVEEVVTSGTVVRFDSCNAC